MYVSTPIKCNIILRQHFQKHLRTLNSSVGLETPCHCHYNTTTNSPLLLPSRSLSGFFFLFRLFSFWHLKIVCTASAAIVCIFYCITWTCSRYRYRMCVVMCLSCPLFGPLSFRLDLPEQFLHLFYNFLFLNTFNLYEMDQYGIKRTKRQL